MRIPVHDPEQHPVEEWHVYWPEHGGAERWRWHHHAADLPLPPELQLAEAQAQVEHLTAGIRALQPRTASSIVGSGHYRSGYADGYEDALTEARLTVGGV